MYIALPTLFARCLHRSIGAQHLQHALCPVKVCLLASNKYDVICITFEQLVTVSTVLALVAVHMLSRGWEVLGC